ncbi:MAG: hypothetical protein Q9170_000703 [Blastenia crenularia]
MIIAHELSNVLCSLRLANIYDLSSRIFLFKFAKPDRREQIIVDSGFRCHLTSFSRDTAAAPSPFVAKLRKHLRTRRVTSVSQIGTDRVIELQFSDGQYRLYLEFYAAGNLVLTDRDLNILSLQRNVPEGTEQEELRVGLRYALEQRQNYSGTPELTPGRVRAALQKALEKAGGDHALLMKKKKPGDALRKALAGSMSEFPPMLIDHALRSTGFDIHKSIADILNSQNLVEDLILSLRKAQEIEKRTTADNSAKGYIFAKVRDSQKCLTESGGASFLLQEAGQIHNNLLYEDFHPFKPLQLETAEWKVIEFETFNKTVDEFFSSTEGQKLESRLSEREQNARRKLETARRDHEKRVGGLQQVQELNIRKAQAIEANLQRVQEAVAAVNGLIGHGMDWVEIARLIDIEQARHNMVADTIQLPLKLHENTITLLLTEEDQNDEGYVDPNATDQSSSESEGGDGIRASSAEKVPKATDTRLAVDIDLALSPWSNARQYYDQKKTAAVKEQKTIQSSAKALKSTEKKVNADLKKGLSQEKQVLRPVRKQLWFEKFYFFISSEGYLVLGGKDAQQNEILYKRYLKKGDIYVHADLNGAASVVVKNKLGYLDDPIPPSTLSQAGSFVVATSSAWDSKAVMSAWWVYPNQISKTASTGEYLTTGSFTIQGEKNYLPPAQLLLGLGILFRVSEECMARHLKHRLQHESLNQASKDSGNPNIDVDTADDEDVRQDDIRQDERQKLGNKSDEPSGEKSGSDVDHEEDDMSTMSHSSAIEITNPLLSTRAEGGMTDQGRSDEVAELSSRADENDDDDNLGAKAESPAEGNSQDQSLEPMSEAALSIVSDLPAQDRELLRKGQSTVATAQDSLNLEENEGLQTTASSVKSSTEARPHKLPLNPQVRGKHIKLNKLKTKYADQDEEDRALALRLLGSAATQKAIEGAAAKAAKEGQLAAQKRRRQYQHVTAARKGKEEEEIRKTILEEGVETIDGTEAEALKHLEAYIGTPLVGDEILDVLVICGPWDAIGTRCSWRAKMQPGSTKKGKAVREVLSMWRRTTESREKKKRPRAGEGNEAMIEEEKVRRREGELIRELREPGIIGVVPVGKVRVAGSEGSSVKGGGGGSAGKGNRGGRGSKKQR